MRRHVVVLGTTYVGKEANRWEEQFFIGLDVQAAIDYGSAPDGHGRLMEELHRARTVASERRLANALGISREALR